VNVVIPDEQLQGLAVSERDLLTDIAIGLYTRDQISLGRAAEIAMCSVSDFQAELAHRRIPIRYGLDDLRQDNGVLNDLPGPAGGKPSGKPQG